MKYTNINSTEWRFHITVYVVEILEISWFRIAIYRYCFLKKNRSSNTQKTCQSETRASDTCIMYLNLEKLYYWLHRFACYLFLIVPLESFFKLFEEVQITDVMFKIDIHVRLYRSVSIEDSTVTHNFGGFLTCLSHKKDQWEYMAVGRLSIELSQSMLTARYM